MKIKFFNLTPYKSTHKKFKVFSVTQKKEKELIYNFYTKRCWKKYINDLKKLILKYRDKSDGKILIDYYHLSDAKIKFCENLSYDIGIGIMQYFSFSGKSNNHKTWELKLYDGIKTQ